MAIRLPEGNAIIGQSGGPTAVINQSLVGVIEGLKGYAPVKKILGMRHGVDGLIKAKPLVDLSGLTSEQLEKLARTPSAALGSSRAKPNEADCVKIFDFCKANDVRYFFYIGGNDSSDTCRIVFEMSQRQGYDMRCIHVPKTVDNDLVCNDHTPGFASAARYVAMAFMADDRDNASLPGIKINVVMGRNAGFLTAASSLARQNGEHDGPHLIYVPEVAFDIDRFVHDVADCLTKHGRCQIAVSEGIKDAAGVEIGAKLISGDKDQHGNAQLSGSGALGDMLSNLLKDRLKGPTGKPPRVRADTLGYMQRCWPDPSPVDALEARQVGVKAAQEAMTGLTDGSITILRTSNHPYKIEKRVVRLGDVAAKTKHMPPEFIQGHNNVTKAFLDYCRPLVGELPAMFKLPM